MEGTIAGDFVGFVDPPLVTFVPEAAFASEAGPGNLLVMPCGVADVFIPVGLDWFEAVSDDLDLCAMAAAELTIEGAFDIAEEAAGDGVVVIGFVFEVTGDGVDREEPFGAVEEELVPAAAGED